MTILALIRWALTVALPRTGFAAFPVVIRSASRPQPRRHARWVRCCFFTPFLIRMGSVLNRHGSRGERKMRAKKAALSPAHWIEKTFSGLAP